MGDALIKFQVIFTIIGGYMGFLLGGIDETIYVLISFIVLDYISGVMVAILNKKVSSEVGFRGIFKKILMFGMVCLANTIDNYLLNGGGTIRTAVVFFYISNEGISILENAAYIGLPIPKKLKDILHELNDEE